MSDARPSFDEERMPWLREVEDEDAPGGISARRMLVALLVVLLVAGAIAGTFFWLGHRNLEGSGQPQLIRAPQAPYKVKPPTAGGLDVAGESQTTFETSAGQNVSGQLDTSKLAETQVVAAPPPAPAKVPPKPETKTPAVQSASAADSGEGPTDGSVVQLGAYKNAAQAERAWLALTSRFPQLSAATKMVVPYSGGYRLRAAASSPAGAKAVCDALQAGGEGCFIAK